MSHYNRAEEVEEVCDPVDAMVFSGDTLADPEALKAFEDMVARWTRGIAQWKQTNAKEEDSE
jgi:hypothetical protein